MRDSLTYQAILDEGRVEGRVEGRAEAAHEMLLDIGERRLGPANERIRAALTAIHDYARLHALAERLDDVTTWDELLDQS